MNDTELVTVNVGVDPLLDYQLAKLGERLGKNLELTVEKVLADEVYTTLVRGENAPIVQETRNAG